MLEIGIVAVEDGDAALLQAGEHFGLGIGDIGYRVEILQMHRLDIGDQGDMRRHLA